MLRGLVKASVAGAARALGADRAIRALHDPGRWPVVVGYHRVVDDLRRHRADTIPAMLISRAMLERHLDWLGRRYRVVTAAELESWLDGDGADATRPVAMITFDDGYHDVYEHAFPLLKRKGLPATVFVVSDLVGTARAPLHDRLYVALARARAARRTPPAVTTALASLPPDATNPVTATHALLARRPQAEVRRLVETLESEIGADDTALDAMRLLTWETLAEMQRNGITVGAHTRTHPVLTNETPAVVAMETAGARRDLETRLGVPVHHFAYPAGCFDTTAVDAVAAAGYRLAYTACRHRDPRRPRLTLSRTLLWERSSADPWQRFSPSILACQLNGVFDLLGGCSQTHGLAA